MSWTPKRASLAVQAKDLRSSSCCSEARTNCTLLVSACGGRSLPSAQPLQQILELGPRRDKRSVLPHWHLPARLGRRGRLASRGSTLRQNGGEALVHEATL